MTEFSGTGTPQDAARHTVAEALARIGQLSPLLFDASQRLTQELETAPRIVLVGRVKSGKSTLLNALVGAPVAETAALEATGVVTVYQYGAPDRAEAVMDNGATVAVRTRRGETAELPAPADQIAFVNRWMPSGAIAQHTLIDTPGLSTLTAERATTTEQAILRGHEQTKRAAVDADAAVFLFDTAPRRDEIEFLNRLGFGPLNTLGLLARADSFGEGALGFTDPIDAAREHAALLARQLSGHVHAVLPVAGLLAESALTGRVTEQLAREVAALSARSTEALVDAFLGAAPSDESLARVVELVGEYGLFRGRDAAASGAASFAEWLVARSGVEELRLLLDGPFSRFASLHRTARVLDRIDRLAYDHPEQRREIRGIRAGVKDAPELIDVSLMLAHRDLLVSAPDSPAAAEVAALLSGTRPAERVGLAPDASPWEILEAVRAKRAWAQSRAFGLLDPSEEQALVLFGRALDHVERYAQALT